MNAPVFTFGADSPLDMLDCVIQVTSFLTEMAPHFAEGKSDIGLSERGAGGLTLILIAVENTVKTALDKLQEN